MKILMSAYACEPGKGSEPGAGWNYATAAARLHDVRVLTRANNRARIEAALRTEAIPTLTFEYLDLPPWASFWKRGRRGVRLYYTLWQIAAARKARQLCTRERVDVVHHVTFANAWLPALACIAPAPFVLGPVAGGQAVPLRLLPILGVRGILTEFILQLRFLGRFNPLVRIAWHRAATVLVNNEETARRLPRAIRAKCQVRTNACVEAPAMPRAGASVDRRLPPRAVCVGRLNRFKGVEIAIEAIAQAARWRLIIIGDGPDRRRLERLVVRSGLSDRIEFTGLLSQADLWNLMGAADALLLPSLKEGASFVAVEAAALGLPVVAFSANGPAILAEIPGVRIELVPPTWPRRAAGLFAEALVRLESQRGVNSRPDVGLGAVARDLDAVYRAATVLTRVPPGEVAA